MLTRKRADSDRFTPTWPRSTTDVTHSKYNNASYTTHDRYEHMFEDNIIDNT